MSPPSDPRLCPVRVTIVLARLTGLAYRCFLCDNPLNRFSVAVGGRYHLILLTHALTKAPF